MPAPKNLRTSAIEIDLMEPFRQQQIVTQPEVPENQKVDANEDTLRFLSGKTQRVKQQLQARQTGLSRNRNQAPSPAQPPVATQDSQQGGTNPRRPIDIRPSIDLSSMAKNNLNLESGVSTRAELLPNQIAQGEMTILNTDPGLYYTFFQRLQEAVYWRWQERVEAATRQVPLSVLKRSVTNKWTTNVEIWLRPDGQFDSAHLMKSSGIGLYDQAAINAFKAAQIFPNPPAGLMDEDGYIRLKFALSVLVNPQALIAPQ